MFVCTAFTSAVSYVPLVEIPGVGGTPADLSEYLIGLYNFLLSIVGIAAVLMLIIGGFKYLTAVGNPSAASEAKSIIFNALFGLILAIISWVIVSEINPDVLVIRKPGLSTDTQGMGCYRNYTAGPPSSCTCINGGVLTTATSASDCNKKCKEEKYCSILPEDYCIEMGTVNDINSKEFKEPPQNGLCLCSDNSIVDPVSVSPLPSDCNTACANEGHCGYKFLRIAMDVLPATPPGGTVNTNAEYGGLTEDSKLRQMYLTSNGIDPDGFGVTAVSYTLGPDTYNCAILLTEIDEGFLGKNDNCVIWVKKGITIKKGSKSLIMGILDSGAKDYSWGCSKTNSLDYSCIYNGAGWVACDSSTSTDPACNTEGNGCKGASILAGTEATDIFRGSFKEVTNYCGDCWFAKEDGVYKPAHTIKCNEKGYWQIID